MTSDKGEVRNPADISEVVGTYPLLGAGDVDAAVEAAGKAQAEWAARPAVERAQLLAEAADRIAALDGFDELLIREQGKVAWEAGFEVGFFEALSSYYAGMAPDLDEGELAVDDGLGQLRIFHEPVGIVGAITPWNWPFALTAVKVVPALLAGNAVIVKPASNTPLTVMRALGAITDLFPSGLLAVLTGPGSTVGRRLLEHPLVRKVSLTGSTETGREAAAVAGQTVKNLTLELSPPPGSCASASSASTPLGPWRRSWPTGCAPSSTSTPSATASSRALRWGRSTTGPSATS